MSQQILKKGTRFISVSKKAPLGKICGELNLQQIRELWNAGDREIIKNYVKEHYLGSAMQEWLMRTRDMELIMVYLENYSSFGLFEEAEDLLMSLKNYKLRKTYLEQRQLCHRSILMLFAEKQFVLLRRYIAKHPEEIFSKTMISLMFETGDKKLVSLYIQSHPSLLKDECFAKRLQKAGFFNLVSVNS